MVYPDDGCGRTQRDFETLVSAKTLSSTYNLTNVE